MTPLRHKKASFLLEFLFTVYISGIGGLGCKNAIQDNHEIEVLVIVLFIKIAHYFLYIELVKIKNITTQLI